MLTDQLKKGKLFNYGQMYMDIFMSVLFWCTESTCSYQFNIHPRILFNFSGTQVQALKLLSGLTETESGIPSVIDNTYAVPYIVCCIKESKCRLVRLGVASLCQARLSLMLIFCYKLGSWQLICFRLVLHDFGLLLQSHDQVLEKYNLKKKLS